MKAEDGSESIIDFFEKRKVMMHGMLDAILESGNAGAIHAIKMNLQVYLGGIETRQKIDAFEQELERLEE